MNRNQRFSGIIAVVLSVLIALSGLACLATGFTLQPINWITLFFALCLIAVVCVFSFRSLKTLLTVGVCALMVLWFSLSKAGSLMLSLEKLLYRISSIYDLGYRWGYIRWSEENLTAVSLTPAMILLGGIIVAMVCFTVCRRKWFGIGAITGLIPVMLCCVVTDTIPATGALMLLAMGLLMLVLTQLSRRQNEATGNRFTAILLIPVMLFTMLMFGFADTYPYAEQAEQLQEWFLDQFTEKPPLPGGSGTVSGGVVSDTIDLSDVGPMTQSHAAELYVTAASLGRLYLRGRSYNHYTGIRWEANANTVGEGGWPYAGLAGRLNIRISMASGGILCFPYYPLEENWTQRLEGGLLRNPSGDRTVIIPIGRPGSKTLFTPLSDGEIAAYLQLPEETRESALDILGNILPAGNSEAPQIAALIAEYVRNSADYDLNTPKMPANSTDFAIWFLEDSDTGYCTHFATAATVLLRAAGVPARYVTGYAVYGRPGVSVKVSGEDAHAWVEYLHPQQGWTMLEVTPEDPANPMPTDPPETTEPTETTQPTEPTETTHPTETTQPTEPSETETLPRPSTAPTQSPSGQSTLPGPGPGPVEQKLDLTWLKYVGMALAFLALMIWQHGLRRKLRRNRLNKGTPNQQALRRWRYVRKAARRFKLPLPEDLQMLAEKAAFSQHTLTAEELHRFDRWLRDAKKRLTDRPLPIRLLWKLIFAL